jgi:enoyl-CoA hydratase/carnithine racemase
MNHWKLEINEMLATLTLNTGRRGNRLTPDTFEDLNEILMSLNFEEVRGLILKSDGDDFSQGFDLSFLLTSKNRDLLAIHQIFSICNIALDRLYNLPIPTMSLISGSCIGGGFLMALATDFRAAHAKAKFGFPEVKQSLVVNLGLKRVYQLIGECRTKELVLLGSPVSSEKLMEWGAINWITNDAGFVDFVQLFIKYVSEVPPLAVRANKKLIQKIPSLTMEESTELENVLQMNVFQSSDFQEAIRSFLEKRDPVFKGK